MISAGTNIFDHVVDDASTVKVQKETTVFSGDDLQTCLEEIDAHALVPLPVQPSATETVSGLIQIATNAETIDTTNNTVAISPMKLKYWFNNEQSIAKATTTNYGVVLLADNSDMSSANDSKAVTVAKLNYYATNVRFASETQTGFARLSTPALAIGGTDHTTIITPIRAKEAIQAWASGTDSNATTLAKGLIRIATPAEVDNDALADIAITPYNLNSRSATTTRRGAFYIANAAVANARSSNDHAVTPGTLNLYQATDTVAGVSKLVNNLTSTDSTAALSAAMGKKLQDEKIGASGGSVTGVLKLKTVQKLDSTPVMTDGRFTASAMLEMYPVGALYLSLSSTNPASIFGGTWTQHAQGRVLIGVGTGVDTNGTSKTFLVNNTGGEYQHVLTKAELPEHKHAGWGEANSNWLFGIATQYGKNNPGSKKTDHDNYLYNSSPVGSNAPHNNVQPYIACYIWLRTA